MGSFVSGNKQRSCWKLVYLLIEKEGLVVKWTVDSLRYYLHGNLFKLVTDRAFLRWLSAMKKYESLVYVLLLLSPAIDLPSTAKI